MTDALQITAITINAHGVQAGDYFDNSPRAVASRRATAYRTAERALLESLPRECPIKCGRRVCEHTLDRMDAAIATLRAEYGV